MTVPFLGEAPQSSEDRFFAFTEAAVLAAYQDVGLVDQENRPPLVLGEPSEDGVEPGVAAEAKRPGERGGEIAAGKCQETDIDPGIAGESAPDGVQEALRGDG